MQSDEYNFIYNDGTFQIEYEEPEKSEPYYKILKDYRLEASFKDKKESFLYVGWRNTRALKETKASELKDLKDLKESL